MPIGLHEKKLKDGEVYVFYYLADHGEHVLSYLYGLFYTTFEPSMMLLLRFMNTPRQGYKTKFKIALVLV